MKTISNFTLSAAVLLLFLGLTTACQQAERSIEAVKAEISAGIPPADTSREALVARGAYLVTTMLCDDCHTPKKMTGNGPEPDMDRRLMGHPADAPLAALDPAMVRPGNWVAFASDLTAAVGPWGVSFAANLTPDPTGTGFWTEENFFKALREGKLKGIDGGRPILPPMPWQNIGKASDEDLRAIFAFLKSLKPIKNVVPPPIPADQLTSLQ